MQSTIQDTRVGDILDKKGARVEVVDVHASAADALGAMVEAKIGSVLVMDDGAIVGIFTERDFTRRVALSGRDARKVPVGEVLTDKVMVVQPDTTIVECMSLMTDRRIRHLPVVADGQVVGLVSIGDCMAQFVQDRAYEVHLLVEFITGGFTR